MTSGLEWAEVHGVFNTDVVPMLYYEITSHFRALSKPIDYSKDKPSWYYSSGTSNILSWILRQTFDNDMDYYRFPTERLFNGMCLYCDAIHKQFIGMCRNWSGCLFA